MNPETLQAIKETVEEAVDTKINGKLKSLKEHLYRQDDVFLEQSKTLDEVKDLLQERRFVIQLWAFLKFVGGTAVAIGGAILLFYKFR